MKNKSITIGLCIILAIAVVALIVCMCTGGGNMDMWDTNYTFDRAIIKMPDGDVLEVDIKQWRDYEGEQVQIIAEDGTIYLVSTFNCILIRDR